MCMSTSCGNSADRYSNQCVVRLRPTDPASGSSLDSQSRGVSIAPPARTTTRASCSNTRPSRSRYRTPRTRRPSRVSSVKMRVAKHPVRISQRPVRTASGAYDTLVERFAVRSKGALSGERHPTMQPPHCVQPSVDGYRNSAPAASATGRIAFGCMRQPARVTSASDM